MNTTLTNVAATEETPRQIVVNLKKIVIWPDAKLKTVCSPVELFDEELETFCTSLMMTMVVSNGYGIAAPQVGDFRRIAIVRVDGKPLIMINPAIEELQGTNRNFEGCLSVPSFRALIRRAASVRVTYQDTKALMHALDTSTLDAQMNQLTPACIQHEVEHLDGITFTDHLSELKLSMARKAVKKHSRV